MFRYIDISIRSMLLSVAPILVCLTLHELAHGYAAYRLGDDTAKLQGRLSLNPLKHLDPYGTIMLLLCGFGFAKPVPINMMRFRDPKRGMAICAAAGPLMNILITAVCLFAYGMLSARSPYGVMTELVYATAVISAALAVFNLIPIPPLDGSRVLFSLLPERIYYRLLPLDRYGSIILMIAVFLGILSPLLLAMRTFVLDMLWPLVDLGWTLMT